MNKMNRLAASFLLLTLAAFWFYQITIVRAQVTTNDLTPTPITSSTLTASPTATPTFTPPSFPTNNIVSWRTPYVTLEADNFYVYTNGKVFRGNIQNQNQYITSNPASDTQTTLEISWYEDNIQMRLLLYFSYTPGEFWKLSEVRTYDGLEPGNWIYYTQNDQNGNPIQHSLGQTYIHAGMIELSNQSNSATGIIHFENLKLKAFAHRTPSRIEDSFDRSNGSTSLGSTGGFPWIITRGVAGISQNQAYFPNRCPAPGYALIDSGKTDGVLEVTLAANYQDARIPFRYIDENNYYWVERQGRNYMLAKRYQGRQSGLGNISQQPTDGDVIRIELNGPTIKVYVNGTLRLTRSDTSINGTKHGIGVWCDNRTRFDNFSIRDISPETGYTLEASPLNPVQLTTGYNVFYGYRYAVAAYLRDHSGAIVTNQSDFSYAWSLDNPLLASISPFTACTNGIQSPCPGDHAEIRALAPGFTSARAVVTRIADNVQVAETVIAIRIDQSTESVFDTFSRQSLSNVLRTESNHPWIFIKNNQSSGYGLVTDNNQAKFIDACPRPSYALVDSGRNDGVLEVTLAANYQDARIPFRYLDENNYYWVERRGRDYMFAKRYQGRQSGMGIRVTPANGDVVKVEFEGTTIRVYINGTLKLTRTENLFPTATKHGIGVWCDNRTRFDDFSISPVPAG